MLSSRARLDVCVVEYSKVNRLLSFKLSQFTCNSSNRNKVIKLVAVAAAAARVVVVAAVAAAVVVAVVVSVVVGGGSRPST